MSDDWSLKDKLIGITGQKRTSTGINPITDLNEYWYKADDIKTLRQKLIQDFKEFDAELFESQSIGIMQVCKKIINRRFGKVIEK